MIRYKVVDKNNQSVTFSQFFNKFRLTYKHGEIINAIPGTLGIFCFKRECDAIEWISNNDLPLGTEIIKVRPIGKGKIPKKISDCTDQASLDRFYAGDIYRQRWNLIGGLICYQQVYVL